MHKLYNKALLRLFTPKITYNGVQISEAEYRELNR